MFEDEIAHIADDRSDVVGLTAAMRHLTGHRRCRAIHRIRSGIAEQHRPSAAGRWEPIRCRGVLDVCALTNFCSTSGLPVTRDAGAGPGWGMRPDGPSHHGLWDLALLACVPEFQIACPRDASATTTVAYRDRTTASHHRAYKGRRANRSRPNTPSVASTSCITPPPHWRPDINSWSQWVP